MKKEFPEGLDEELIRALPYSFAKKNLILPFKRQGEAVLALVADPNNLDAIEEASWLLGVSIRAEGFDPQLLSEKINAVYEGQKSRTSELIAHIEEQEPFDPEEVPLDLLENKESSPIVALLNEILKEAIQQGASDIHFDPLEDHLQIRYRIDGLLHTRHQPATEFQSQLITRIKVLAKLDIAERRLPQDGRVKMIYGGREIDFRISTTPVIHGERIVMRILDRQNINLGLDRIGMPPHILELFRDKLATPEGIILVTGPTGSGKTTTLYSAISDLVSPKVNIMTIEDPVEYKVQGVAQIQVVPKIDFTFARGLRQILRQDPDIIMVGEIRDVETAIIAVQAALTGHLVLSTLHTNDAPSAVIRLRDMGIEPYLISSSLVGVIGQRLVRKLCDCKLGRKPTEEECRLLAPNIPEKIFSPQECSHCFQSGYKGRIGLYEWMLSSPEVCRGITEQVDSTSLKEIALRGGYRPLYEHGLDLVREGWTTLSEVLRVSKSSKT
ncbi:Type IV fimbrial assembly, ATPase PilB [Candidatus Similichlamydia laticola]|uniref:Type IV fimbrial assembly, ATPase PilB n=1 Tax=Candidatus Similichlamydia laticola TaxID=2170265 RepID=A0A369KB77_9BACT|nr:GspE/PulE family protein [Candidatus Similichlamydia laticola]RDB31168.1 Type IV fimbrial assembly, ATPase PilB [Candidatus Similichlamydia laticola]